MYFILSLFPIVLALVLMTRFKVAPGKALPFSALVTAVTAIAVWKIPLLTVLAVSCLGVARSLDIILIVAGAVLLLNLLKSCGALEVINNTFANLSRDRRIQVVIIAWVFSNFIEGAAGFGAAPALAAPLLVGLGFPVIPAVMVSMVCNTLTVPFGAVGIPITTIKAILTPDLIQSGMVPDAFISDMLKHLTWIFAVSGAFLPFTAVAFMIIISGGKRKLRSIIEIMPFCLFGGAAYVLPWRYAALKFGPELADILGAVVAMPLILLVMKSRILTPEYVWEFPDAEIKTGTPNHEYKMGVFKAWMPYILIAVILTVTRIPQLAIKPLLAKFCCLRIPSFFGVNGTDFSWSILVNPGVFPFIAVTIFCSYFYGRSSGGIMETIKSSEKQTRGAALAIAASFVMVQIMIFSAVNPANIPGMLDVIARTAADCMGRFYIAAAPVIGVFGTFFSGSCTVSNILFGNIQFHSAKMLGMNEVLIIALQNVGGGLGSMIRISGVVAACAIVNASGKEGKITLLNMIPLGFMLILVFAASMLCRFFI